jgi:hypothetical protein
VQVLDIVDITPNVNTPSKWPLGCKKTKEDQKATKQPENNITIKVHAIANMAMATLERIAIIWDQNMKVLFSMFND